MRTLKTRLWQIYRILFTIFHVFEMGTPLRTIINKREQKSGLFAIRIHITADYLSQEKTKQEKNDYEN